MKLQRWKKESLNTFLGNPTTVGSRNSHKNLQKVEKLTMKPLATALSLYSLANPCKTRRVGDKSELLEMSRLPIYNEKSFPFLHYVGKGESYSLPKSSGGKNQENKGSLQESEAIILFPSWILAKL